MNNLHEFYDKTTLEHKDAILFDNEITYRQAYDLAVKRAAYIRKMGHKQGDVIGICAINSREWCMTYMAITMSGCIALPLDNNLPADQFLPMLKTVNAKTVFCSDDTIEKFPRKVAHRISFDDNLDEARYFVPAAVDKDYPASYCFTSGTTGNAKIVTLTHGNIFLTAVHDSTYLGLSVRDNFLCILPLFHVYAFVANFTGPFAKGASLVFLQSLKGPDIIAALRDNKFTIFPAAPQLWEMFMDSILNKTKSASAVKYAVLSFFLSTTPFFNAVGLGFLPRAVFKPVRTIFGETMKYFISGGAPLKKKYFKYYQRMGLPIIEGYGLTETTGPICISNVEKNKIGSVGPAMPGNEIKIKNINSDGIGEVWLRGHSVMKEYYNNPELTADVFDDDGFFDTGDLGRVDSDGYLFITGRLKNVIVLDSGKNVYPEELESYYKLSPYIAEISVFGRTVNGRETVYAVIVPEEKAPKSYGIVRDEIRRLNKGLPSYKTIGGFALSFDPLPVNSARKVVVHEVIRHLEKGDYMTAADDTVEYQTRLEAENGKQERVIAILKKHLGTDQLYAHESLTDHGVDSLGMVELIVSLEEELSISIDVNKTKKLNTVQELVRYVASLEKGERGSLDTIILGGKIRTKTFTFYNPLIEICAAILRFVTYKRWHMTVHDREQILVDNTILVSNHQSNLDFLLMFVILPYRIRKNLFVIGKKELSFLRFIFPGSNVLYIERGGDVVTAMKASADLLRRGKSLYIFPEGTRSNPGTLGEFKTGAAYLAKNLDKKVVPIAISGTGKILPKGMSFPPLTTSESITVTVGDPVDPGAFESVEHLNQHLYFTVNSLLEEGGQ
ncbi:MAG: AMP-binding protein [Spirochaetota bacterium]